MPDLFYCLFYYICRLNIYLKNMKKILNFLSAISFCLVSCQGTVDPGNQDDANNTGNTDNLEGNITLYAQKDVIKADGAYASELSVILVDSHGEEHDVTKDVEIYIEGQDEPVKDVNFKTTVEGDYAFYAVRGFDISNTVTVKAVKGVPALPADPDAAKTSFAHRMLLVQHTGNECPNCPKLMDILKHIADDEEYAFRYLHVASHSYNSTDAAYSSAAQTLSKTMNLTKYYPMVTYNLTTDDGCFEDEIKEAINSCSKESADAGISASSAVVGNQILVNVSLKAAVDSKYRLAVWVLEDNIHSPQSGATASWHNMHSNCLRLMYGSEKNEQIYGKHLGMIEAGESVDMIAAIQMDEEWIAENCKLLLVAVSGNGDYSLVNCTYCPVEGSISYNYL